METPHLFLLKYSSCQDLFSRELEKEHEEKQYVTLLIFTLALQLP